MDQITVKAWAKINPYLEVLYKRPDGYHELVSVMQTLSLYDTVLIKKVRKYRLRLICEPDRLPCDERNLVFGAAEYMINEYGINQGLFIKLSKRIPVSAGLGGGSSDCAATLIGINKLFDLNIKTDKLAEIAGTFGADVPFFILGGTALVTGIGERCEPLPPHPHCWVVLARPPVMVSTPTVFKNWKPTDGEPGAEKFISAVRRGDINEMAKLFSNSLLPVTAGKHPEINALITDMKNLGAKGASMSGSGPTVFGYFRSKSSALEAVDALKKEHPSIRELYLTEIYNPI